MSDVANLVDVGTIINTVFNLFLNLRFSGGVTVAMLITVCLCVGFVIHSLANKEP